MEKYFIKLGEQGDEVRTNFSDLSDEKMIELSWWAINELGAQNTHRHPHTGDVQFIEKTKSITEYFLALLLVLTGLFILIK